MSRFPAFLLALVVCLSTPAAAQEAAEDFSAGFDGIAIEDIPEEYLEEMNQVYLDCANNSVFSTYFDCRCQAMRFLEERIRLGPRIARNAIMTRVNTECVNKAGIAGYSYDVCTEMVILRNYTGYRKMCECFANTVAEEYAARPYLKSRNVISIQRDAYITCGFTE
jgi:hypothetical protein